MKSKATVNLKENGHFELVLERCRVTLFMEMSSQRDSGASFPSERRLCGESLPGGDSRSKNTMKVNTPLCVALRSGRFSSSLTVRGYFCPSVHHLSSCVTHLLHTCYTPAPPPVSSVVLFATSNLLQQRLDVHLLSLLLVCAVDL